MTHKEKLIALLKEMGVQEVTVTANDEDGYSQVTTTWTADDHAVSFVFLHDVFDFIETPLRPN
jgi:hypothetical protein